MDETRNPGDNRGTKRRQHRGSAQDRGRLRRRASGLFGLGPGALFCFDRGVRGTLVLVGAEDRAQGEPEQAADQDGRADRVEDPADDVMRHGARVRRGG